MPISHNLKSFFIHIPKNAGTAISNSKKANFLMNGHYSAMEMALKFPKEWNEYFKFAIIRNPWDRLVSNYEYARMETSYWHSADSSRPYSTHFDYHTLKDKSFEDCVNMLYYDRNVFKHQGWVPQYTWICDKNGNIMVDKLFYYENLETNETFKKLLPDLEKVNLTTKKYTDYKDYYNKDLVDKVFRIYEKDINLFEFKY